MSDLLSAHPVLTMIGLLLCAALLWVSVIGSKAYKQAMLELTRERDEGAKRMMTRRAETAALIERLNRSTLETQALTSTVAKLQQPIRQHRVGLDRVSAETYAEMIERLNRDTDTDQALADRPGPLSPPIRQHRAGLDVDVAQAMAARARMASNMPQDEALTAAERGRLERLKVPTERAPAALALDLGMGQRLTPEQEHRIRQMIRDEIARARAREMGTE